MPSPRVESALAGAVNRFLASLDRRNASGDTVRSYRCDLEQFIAYFSLSGENPPEPQAFDHLMIREFMGECYARGNQSRSVARKLSAVRALLRFLAREGTVEKNPAKLVATPKTPQKLPAVMSAEQTNGLIDSIEAESEDRQASVARDRLIFELLYGCGLRVSELVNIDLRDIDLSARWIRVQGKGR
jgi:integrase/recombinase XerC